MDGGELVTLFRTSCGKVGIELSIYTTASGIPGRYCHRDHHDGAITLLGVLSYECGTEKSGSELTTIIYELPLLVGDILVFLGYLLGQHVDRLEGDKLLVADIDEGYIFLSCECVLLSSGYVPIPLRALNITSCLLKTVVKLTSPLASLPSQGNLHGQSLPFQKVHHLFLKDP